MNIRVLVMLSLLVAIGAVLHTIVPPYFLGMRPDMMLAMMFLGILLFPKASYVLILSLTTGFISALTTTVPGGQIANIIDKPLTAFAFFGLVLATKRLSKFKATQPVLAALGTMISGSIFLLIVLNIVGLLDASFGLMFMTVVLPAAAFNLIFVAIMYPIATKILRRTSLQQAAPTIAAK